MLKQLKLLKQNRGFLRYFKNTSWLMGEKILRLLMIFFVGVWVARYLGPEQLGFLSYAQSFVGLFVAFAALGLDSIIVKELVKDQDRRNVLLGTAFTLKLIGAITILIGVSAFIYLTSDKLEENAIIYVIMFATLFQSFNVIDFYFQSKVMSKYIVYVNIFGFLLSSVIKILLILNVAPLAYFAYIIVFDAFILAIGYVYVFSSQKISISNWSFDFELAKQLLLKSWPLILSGLMISIYMKIDQIMIREMLDAESVGIYSVAVRLSQAWYFIPIAIVSSVFPAIVSAKETNQAVFIFRMQKLYSLLVWMAIAIAIPTTIFGGSIVTLLFGVEYAGAAEPLVIHIWASIFVFMGVAFSRFLISENYFITDLYRTMLGLLINVGFNFLFIPKYGITGAAVATLLGQFSANYLYDVFDRKLHEQLWLKTKSFNPLYLIKR